VYPIRVVAVFGWFLLMSPFVLLVSCLRPFKPANGTLYTRALGPVALWLLGLRLEVRGHEKIASAMPCVFLLNHQHLLDLFVVATFFPPRTVTIGKKSLAWVPLFGWIYLLSGHLLIDRGNRSRAVQTLDRAGDLLKARGLSVMVCPEGTRSRGRGLLPFKQGAFRLALMTGLPVQAWVVKPYDSPESPLRPQRRKVLVSILDPVPSTGDAESLAKRMHGAFENELARLASEK